MSAINELIYELKTRWGQPTVAVHRGERCPFLLTCNFASTPAEELTRLPIKIPDELREFWSTAREATLFKDQQYGQWGLEILAPTEALNETRRQVVARARDFQISDLVIGRFFGDSDLVIVACDESRPDFGAVTIALPIDKREAWPVVATTFKEFLEKLLEAEGDKYWESRN